MHSRQAAGHATHPPHKAWPKSISSVFTRDRSVSDLRAQVRIVVSGDDDDAAFELAHSLRSSHQGGADFDRVSASTLDMGRGMANFSQFEYGCVAIGRGVLARAARQS